VNYNSHPLFTYEQWNFHGENEEPGEGQRTTWRGGDGWLTGEDDLKPVVETAVELAA
jgi:hypothetical protein